MVSFTCNNCGDSVRKVRVEKHFKFECKKKSGGPNLCCIDCLKDFSQDYEGHTSCKSENERYGAKGTFVAKDSKMKLAKKQLSWSEIIQSSSAKPSLSQSFRDILDVLKDSDNVPRKEAKYKNFCKNNGHLRRFSEADIFGVFALLQDEMKKHTDAIAAENKALASSNKENTKQPPVENENKKRKSSDNTDSNDEISNKKMKPNEENEKVSKKKKNKNKSITIEEETTIKTEVEEVQQNGEGKKKKKDKKKNGQDKAETTEIENGTADTPMNGSAHTPMNGSADTPMNETPSKSPKKKNKKKKNKNKDGEVKTESTDVENGSADTPMNGSVDTPMNETPSKSPKKKRKSNEPEKTPFKDIVVKLLKPGTEFKLKSLKKMVFAVYKSGEEEVPREVRENFNKKLSKIPNVTMSDKIVKMAK